MRFFSYIISKIMEHLEKIGMSLGKNIAF